MFSTLKEVCISKNQMCALIFSSLFARLGFDFHFHQFVAIQVRKSRMLRLYKQIAQSYFHQGNKAAVLPVSSGENGLVYSCMA